METKRVKLQLDVSRNTNPQWRRLWDILLRPPQTKTVLEIKEPTPAEIPSADALPEKPAKKSKPEQLSLFPLDKASLERDDIRPSIHEED